MEKMSCDNFWQWGNARKRFSFTKIDAAGSGSYSMLNESRPVAGGSSFKFTNGGGGLLKARKFTDATFISRSLVISEHNASKSGGPCKDMGLRVQCSTVDVNLSPISVIQSPNVSFSSDTSTSNCRTTSCHPHDGLSPELPMFPCCSDENFVQDGDFCKDEEPSKLRVLRRSSSFAEGILSRETSKEASSPSCSESENMQLQSWGMNEETKNLMAMGGSEATSSYMDSCCKRPKTAQSPISNISSEIQNEKSESFPALYILADLAIWVLKNGLPGYKGEDKAKDSTVQWALFHPTGVPFLQKRVIRRAKSAFTPLSQLHGDADKLVAADSELLLKMKLGSPECIYSDENQLMDGGIGNKDHGAIQSVRSSKRTRSQFLNSKYCDSVLQPLKKGWLSLHFGIRGLDSCFLGGIVKFVLRGVLLISPFLPIPSKIIGAGV